MTSKGIKYFDNKIEWSDEQYSQYIQNFNFNIDEINNEISNLESAYEKIIVLNKQIKNTDIHRYRHKLCTDEYFTPLHI